MSLKHLALALLACFCLACNAAATPDQAKADYVKVAEESGPVDKAIATRVVDLIETGTAWETVDEVARQADNRAVYEAFKKWRAAAGK